MSLEYPTVTCYNMIVPKIRPKITEDNHMTPIYLSIQPEKTGKRIKQLLTEQGYTIREIQGPLDLKTLRLFINGFLENHCPA